MEQFKINRINELAKKSRENGLTEAEKEEQKKLREEYVASFKNSLLNILDNTVIVDECGNKRKLNKKN